MPPRATTHAPPSNHTCPPEQPRMPPPGATTHAPQEQPCMPPLGATTHAPQEQPRMPPRATMHAPPCGQNVDTRF